MKIAKYTTLALAALFVAFLVYKWEPAPEVVDRSDEVRALQAANAKLQSELDALKLEQIDLSLRCRVALDSPVNHHADESWKLAECHARPPCGLGDPGPAFYLPSITTF